MQNPLCRRGVPALLLCAFFFACTERPPVITSQPAGISKELADRITVGTYSGHYSKGILTLAINYLSGSIASGYDIHKGLRRNLNGSVEQKEGRLEFVLKEPGGNPYDGTFFLYLDTASDKITGKWTPTDPHMAKEGPLELARSTGENDDLMNVQWEGDLGTLDFLSEGVCTLEYYPDTASAGESDPNAQLVTVKGSYEVKGDTIRIDWQRNNRTPTLNMRLILREGKDDRSSDEYTVPSLEGKGVKFVKDVAG
jgi:hypothetical protein